MKILSTIFIAILFSSIGISQDAYFSNYQYSNALTNPTQMAISNDLAKAEDLKQAAIDAERAYNLALAEARAEAQTIIEEAKAEIKQELLVATEKADVEISKNNQHV